MKATLFAPDNYVWATPEIRAMVTNGCGPGGWKVDLIPDTMYGLDVSEACNIHDWMYTTGATLADKDEADRVFLNNCLRLIDAADSFWFIKKLRRARAKAYFEAVHIFGGPAFWAGKNDKKNLVQAGVAGIRG
ncbi:MAG: hypothetical protein HXX17_11875 [Geobacteraceae bacterium]|nr:hypothetical protein [Geobacteraceae bacterium]